MRVGTVLMCRVRAAGAAAEFAHISATLRCPAISGDLIILHKPHMSLEGLGGLVSVGGSVLIAFNTALLSLARHARRSCSS